MKPITEISTPWKRRALLCIVIIPTVVAYICVEVFRKVISITKEAVLTFTDIWKGV
jgi:uncharacterized membrane protein